MEELDDWIETEIALELKKITLEDLESTDEEADSINAANGSAFEQSPSPQSVDRLSFLQRYLAVRSSQTKDVADEMNLLVTEHGFQKQNIIQPSILSPPLSPHLSQTQLISLEEENPPVDHIATQMRETEQALAAVMEERKRIELHQQEELFRENKRRVTAALVLQSIWRGYRVRYQLFLWKERIGRLKRSISAIVIQRFWRRYLERKRTAAARKIQLNWRRYRLRHIVKAVLAAGRKEMERKITELEEERRRQAIEYEEERKKQKIAFEEEKKKQERELQERKKRQQIEFEEKRKQQEMELEKERKRQEKKLEEEKIRLEMELQEKKKRQEKELQQERKRQEMKLEEERKRQELDLQEEKKKREEEFVRQSQQSVNETDDSHDQETSNELAHMAALREIRSQEELCAQISRQRMSNLMSQDELMQAATVARNDPEYKIRLEHASSPLSPHAWVGVVEERQSLWKEKRKRLTITKAPPLPFPPHIIPQALTRPVSDAQLLASSPEGTRLSQVKVVHMFGSSRGGLIDLSSFSRCPNLRILSLAKCSLVVFNNIGEGNAHLQDISLSSNRLEYIDCTQLPQLRFLDLSDNHLSSIHGLQFCRDLLELSLDENRIARIGGLDGCGFLQRLSLNGNLVINSAGVVSLPRLQYLSLAENHLPVVLGLEACPLLQFVNLHQNNLQECITLSNHVLLRELDLSGNSLSDIKPIEEAWLPLLQTLRVANNCVSDISSLTCCIMLTSLDIRHNSLFDFPGFLQSLRGCYQLTDLSLDGNPITHESMFKKRLLKVLPSLRKLDDVEVKQAKVNIPTEVINHSLRTLALRQLCEQDEMKQRHSITLESVSVDSADSPSVLTEILDLKVAHSSEYYQLLRYHFEEHVHFNGSCLIPVAERIKNDQFSAALMIQKHWKGYRERSHFRKSQRAAVTIQSTWRRHYTAWKQRSNAAVTIQSCFRGYSLRKKLRTLLSSQSFFENEPDMEEIDFDESFLLKLEDENLKPLSPTDEEIDELLSQPSPETELTIPTFSLPGAVQEEVPMEAGWQSHDSLMAGHMTRKPHCSPSKHKQQIMDEWGFSSQETANLMMKRAGRHKKLRRISQQRIRLGDPSERLLDFRKNCSHIDNSHTHQRLMPDNATGSVTYQWSHQKKVIHRHLLGSDVKSPPKVNMVSASGTSPLPQMELHVLVGHTPRLMTSKAQNELVRKVNLKQAWDK